MDVHTFHRSQRLGVNVTSSHGCWRRSVRRLLNSARGRDLAADARARGRRAVRDVRARALQGARARRAARVPRLRADDRAPTPATGSPTTVVREYRASRSMPGRMAAMSLAAARARTAAPRASHDELDAIHFPLSVMLPPLDTPPAATTVLDVQHEVFPEFFSRAELAYRRRVYGWTVRKSRIVITISEHARQALIERLHLDPDRVRAIHLAVDHDRFTPGRTAPREPFLALPRERLEAQEPRAAVRGVRARCGASGPTSGSCSPAPGHDRLTLPDGAESRGHVTLDELVEPLPQRRRARLPEPVRGLRDPLRRGDGLRLPGGRLERRLAPGGLRRRRRLLRPARPGVDRRRDPHRPRPIRRQAGRARRPVHLGRVRPPARRGLRGAGGATA